MVFDTTLDGSIVSLIHSVLIILDQDGAEPNPNSVAAQNLWRLSALVDKQEYKVMSEKVMTAFRGQLSDHPVALPEMLCAVINHYQSPKQVCVSVGRGHGVCECGERAWCV